MSGSGEELESLTLYEFVEVLHCTNPRAELSGSGHHQEHDYKEGVLDQSTEEGQSNTASFFIETFAFTSDAKALVIAAVSSCHELIFIHGSSENPGDVKSIKFPWCHDPEKRIACVTLSHSGRWLVCVLENGSLEIVPTKLALGEVTTKRTDPGLNPLFSEEEFTHIPLSVRSDGLGLPTCAVWYETRNRRPMLFYSNKGGDILVVDMMIRKLAVTLQAPQSIHNMEIVQDAALTDIYLLVTGFAGTQWMVPLEQGDLSMRETLGQIIPSELKEVGNTEDQSVFSVESRGTRCVGVLKSDLNRFQVFNTVSLVNPALDIGLPSNTSVVHYADSVTFSLKDDKDILAALNMSSAMDQHSKAAQRFTQTVTRIPEDSRFLGFVPLRFRLRPQVIETGVSRKLSILTKYVDTGISPRMKKQFSLLGGSMDRSDECLPGCFVVTDSGIYTMMPACGGDDLFLSCLIPTFNLAAAEGVCMTLELDFRRTVYSVVPRILAERSMEPEVTMKLCEASEMPITDVVRVFCAHGHHKFILPHLEAWLLQRRVMTDMAREELSKLAFDMHMRMIGEAEEYEKHVKEHSFRDFLLHNPWYPTETCLEELIHRNLWSCASVLLKVHDLSETAVRELLSLSPAEWETSDSFVELLTLPNHARLFTNRWDLAEEFLTQLETFASSWKERRHLKNLLALTNPHRPEIQNLLKIEEANTSRAEFAAAKTLTSQIANLFLKTLVKYVYTVPAGLGTRKGSSNSLTRSGNFTPGYQTPQQPQKHYGDELVPAASPHQPRPTQMTVNVAGNCRPLACGAVHSCLVTSDGLFCWGKCKDGLLGNENMGNTQAIYQDSKQPLTQDEAGAGKSSLPVMVVWPYPSMSVLSIVCGTEHTLLLTEEGEVFSWGQNRLGQLGMGDRITRRKPDKIPFFAAEDGNFRAPQAVFSGQYHCAVIDSKSEVYTWGWGVHGQLGLGRSVEDETAPRKVRYFQDRGVELRSVALGYAHSVFLSEGGEVYVCGNGVYGQLGLFTIKKRSVPERLRAPGMTGVSQIAAGHFHNVGLTEDGRLWTWGATPQSLKFKALLQKRKQAAETKGDRANGGGLANIQSEGLAAIEGKHLKPSEIDLSQAILKSERITQVECGFHHSAILTDSGQLYTWGKNLEFQLGHGDKKERLTPSLVTSVGDGRQWRFVSCGSEYMMGVDKHGLIWGWGRNDTGQLGFESLPESEKHRLSGKVLTIQSKSKNQRTIMLPQDGRTFVSKPTRLVGLSVGPGSQPSDQDTEHGHLYDEETLIDSLKAFQGRFRAEDLAERCVDSGAVDVSAYVWLLDGNIIEALKAHSLAIKARNAPAEEVASILNFYRPYFQVIPSQHVLKRAVEVLSLELSTQREEVERLFLSNLELWGRPIAALLRSEPGTLSGLGPEVKLKALMFQVETGAEDEDKDQQKNHKPYTEIPQEIIQDTVRFGDKYCYVFNCGHILSEGTVQSQLNDLKAIQRVNSSFPQTAALVQNYFLVHKNKDTVKVNSPLCPNCMGSKLLQLAETVLT